MKKKYIKIFKKKRKNILLNLLIKSKNIYGDFFKETKKEIIPFIYGIRNNNTIINLNKIIINLKRIFFLLKYSLIKKNNILIIGNSIDIKFLLNNKFIKNKKNLYFLNKKWIEGLITNYKKKEFFKKKFQLIIIIKSSINKIYLNKEIISLNIPIISFIRTKQKIKNIDYFIISNLINIKSIYILMFLIRKIL